jgi:hypothetical protein
MVSPELPTGIPIGHPIFDHQADRQGHHPMRVMAAWRSHRRQVGTEILVTGFAVVLRIGQAQLAGSTGHQVTDIVQPSREHMLARCRLAAPWTRALGFHARLLRNLGFGQIFEASESHIGPILAGAYFG